MNSNMSCRICKIALMPFPAGPDGEEILVHTRPWDQYDHDPVPVPNSSLPDRKLICDFCGELGATWRYYGKPVKAFGLVDLGLTDEIVRDSDGIWSACARCDRPARRGDIEGLVASYRASLTPTKADWYLSNLSPQRIGDDQVRADTMVETGRRLWSAYLPTVFRRELVIAPKPLPPIKPAQMPKVRDRLVDFWKTDAARQGVFHDVAQAARIMLPGYLYDHEGFMVGVGRAELTDAVLDRHLERVCRDLLAAELYWVSPQFTHMAVTAAKKLPDITIERTELPAANGMIIWQDPIYEINLPGRPPIPVRSAAWSLIPGGVWVTIYMPPESGAISTLEPEVMRREIGWLMPWSAGGGAAFGTHDVIKDGADDGNNMLLRSLVSTWLLMRQPGMAEESAAEVYPDIRKKYKRAGRPEPSVRVINIRKKARPRPSGDQSSRNYTGAWTVGWETGGFWRTYWTGSGRSVRDRRWIDPYVARGDLPMKGDAVAKPTVRVLK